MDSHEYLRKHFKISLITRRVPTLVEVCQFGIPKNLKASTRLTYLYQSGYHTSN